MKLDRLLELAGAPVGKQLNELDGIEVKHNKDTIGTLRMKLKNAGVNVTGLGDEMILKFANAMKEITIESLKAGNMLKEFDTSDKESGE